MGMIKVLGTTNEKVKVGFAHAMLNDLAVGITAFKWWSRRDNPAYVPDGLNVALSAATLPGLFIAAWLGGQLVYKYSVGVTKLAKEVKAKGN